MRILLTGATGYVGSNLIPALEGIKNYQLFAITRNGKKIGQNVSLIDDEAPDFDDIIKSANPELVIHLASYLTPNSNPDDINNLLSANISFGTKLLNALKQTDLKCFINVGSFSEYHLNDGVLNPTYLYAATKTAFRSILKYYAELRNFKVVHVIPYTIYGGNRQKKILDILFDSLETDRPIKMSEGTQKLDFIHIFDVVDFFKHLVEKFLTVTHDDVLYLGTGNAYTLREISSFVEHITNKKANVIWGANLPRERDTVYACAAMGKLKAVLNWQPKISIQEGLNLKYKQAE